MADPASALSDVQRTLLAWAWEDPELRHRLRSDPRSALEDIGMEPVEDVGAIVSDYPHPSGPSRANVAPDLRASPTPVTCPESDGTRTVETTEPQSWRAMSLVERTAAPNRPPPLDERTYRRWLHHWMRVGDFPHGELLAARASAIGLTVSAFAAVSHPGGARELKTRIRPKSHPCSTTAVRTQLGDAYLAKRPLLEAFLGTLARADVTLADAGVPAVLRTAALHHLGDRVTRATSRLLILKLNVGRIRRSLEGSSSPDRFERFVSSPDLIPDVSSSHAVCLRVVDKLVDQCVAAAVMLATRLETDRAALSASLLDEHRGPVESAEIGLSDPHRGGQSVAIVRFANGERIVYKPRPLAAEGAFGGYISSLTRLRHPVRAAGVLNRGSYGYMEHVAAEPCADVAGVERFYWRQGALLAVLRLLGADDVHRENVIACGDQPVLIDLECLFHAPRLSGALTSMQRAGLRANADSVLRSALLPSYIDGQTEIGGMGGRAGQLSSRPQLVMCDVGSDRMHIEARHLPVTESANLPTLDGARMDPLDWVDAIVAGFESTHEELSRCRSEILGAGGVLEGFAGVRMRRLVRPTALYASMLRDAAHPDFMRSGPERDLAFERLWRTKAMVGGSRVVEAERRQLWDGDMPCFVMAPEERHLRDEADRVVVEDYMEDPPLEAARRLAAAMDDDDRRRQAALVRTSFGVLRANVAGEPAHRLRSGGGRPPTTPNQLPATDEALVQGAIGAGRRIAADMELNSQAPSWFVVAPRTHDTWQLRPAGPDLYHGQTGIGVFFAALAERTGVVWAREIAGRVVESLVDHVDRHDRPDRLGAYMGWPSIAWGLELIGRRLPDLAAPHCVETALERAAQSAGHDGTTLDVIGGAAGGALVACSMVEHHPRAGETLARACARLLREGMAGESPYGQGLTGMAHGAAGLALALHVLADHGFGADLVPMRDRLLSWEASQWSDAAGTWHDRWQQRGDGDPAGSWCHGASGIGMSRLAIDGVQRPGDVARAVAATRRSGWNSDDSLCHGVLGNVDLLLLVETPGEAPGYEEARVWGRAVLARARNGAFTCGGPSGVTVPGLMIGLAGIGYQLLRLAEPNELPSLLTPGALDTAVGERSRRVTSEAKAT